ncbi:hypothetical protein [Prosthecobacter sp.]|jgi:hypothetical protein|uniref:hypothetical protein n=1 Tax=Prosthecobacter sp. TaxID=1965333 RepID=UPI0037C955DA
MSQFVELQLILGDGFSKEEAVAVTMGSRSMLNFVERRLAVGRHESEFTKLNIYCSKSAADSNLIRYKEPKGFVGIKVQMDPGDFLSPLTRFQETCALMVREGVRAASQHIPLPEEDVSRAIGNFIDGGFVNQWIHADKTWKRAGFRSIVRCDLRTDAFVLTQSFYRDQKLLADAMIARTKPREFLFHPLLGKLTHSHSQIAFRTPERIISSYDMETGKLLLPDDNIAPVFDPV